MRGGGWGWEWQWQTIYMPISTKGSGMPTMKRKTGYPVKGIGAGGEGRVDKGRRGGYGSQGEGG